MKPTSASQTMLMEFSTVWKGSTVLMLAALNSIKKLSGHSRSSSRMYSFCPQDKHGNSKQKSSFHCGSSLGLADVPSWWMKFHFQTAMQLIAFGTVWLETYHSIIHDYQSLRRGIKYIKLYGFNKIIYSVLWFLSVLALGIH